LPLKEKDIVERNLINDIFYKIPEIHVHHELFLSSLKAKFDNWDTRQTIGDILLNIVNIELTNVFFYSVILIKIFSTFNQKVRQTVGE
jgi:hypothetical protein